MKHSCSFKPSTSTNPLSDFQGLYPDSGSSATTLRERLSNREIGRKEHIPGKLNDPIETTVWKAEIQEAPEVDSIQEPWKEAKKPFQGIDKLFYTKPSGETESASDIGGKAMDKSPLKQTNTVPLEPETGTELCRVKLEGGSLGGYRSDILTENLSEREEAVYKCTRCNGIMKDASIGNAGEQLCFHCQRKAEQIMPNANIHNTILSLKCACPLSKRGCEWLGRLEIVENHLTTCGHVYESCQLLCGVVTTRDEMGRHKQHECSQREEACLYCSGVHKVCEMVEHVKVCGKVEVLCELGCGTRVRRESILFHLESECPKESVVCPYEKYGCEVVGLKRRELKKHLEDNWRTHTELKLDAIGETLQIVVLSNKSLEKQVEILEEILIKDEGIVDWSIENFISCFKSNLPAKSSEKMVAAGYTFRLRHWTDEIHFHIGFTSFKGHIQDFLNWPLKAMFTTRVSCHGDIKNSLKFKSPIMTFAKGDYVPNNPKPICSTDLRDFISSGSLDLEITLRILKK